jgi:hypothetical protein
VFVTQSMSWAVVSVFDSSETESNVRSSFSPGRRNHCSEDWRSSSLRGGKKENITAPGERDAREECCAPYELIIFV